jgi:hypothetical protein
MPDGREKRRVTRFEFVTILRFIQPPEQAVCWEEAPYLAALLPVDLFATTLFPEDLSSEANYGEVPSQAVSVRVLGLVVLSYQGTDCLLFCPAFFHLSP